MVEKIEATVNPESTLRDRNVLLRINGPVAGFWNNAANLGIYLRRHAVSRRPGAKELRQRKDSWL